MTSSTRTVWAIQSTGDRQRGGGLFYRKTTGARQPRNRQWVELDKATTFPHYTAAVRQQTALDVGRGAGTTRVVELEMNLRVRGKA